jgi:hypothetical protein
MLWIAGDDRAVAAAATWPLLFAARATTPAMLNATVSLVLVLIDVPPGPRLKAGEAQAYGQ